MKKVVKTALAMLQAAWRFAVRPASWRWVLILPLGTLIRVLAIGCFVATVQALLLAALPDSRGLIRRMLPAEIFMGLDPALWAAGAVVLMYGTNLAVQAAYQRQLGAAINTAQVELLASARRGWADEPEARKIAGALCTAVAKVGEIAIFQSMLVAWLALSDLRILAVFLVSGIIVLPVFLLVGKGHAARRLAMLEARRAISSGPQDEISFRIEEFRAADERFRYRKQLSPGIEGFVVGSFTALVIAGIVVMDVKLSPSSAFSGVFIIFALRYAIVYVREFARALTLLFDLRTERLFKLI